MCLVDRVPSDQVPCNRVPTGNQVLRTTFSSKGHPFFAQPLFKSLPYYGERKMNGRGDVHLFYIYLSVLLLCLILLGTIGWQGKAIWCLKIKLKVKKIWKNIQTNLFQVRVHCSISATNVVCLTLSLTYINFAFQHFGIEYNNKLGLSCAKLRRSLGALC